jgi:hypothetical protein
MRHQHAGVEEAIAGLEASLHEAERAILRENLAAL